MTSVSNLSKTSFIGKIRSVHIIYGTSSWNKGVNITGNTNAAFLSVARRGRGGGGVNVDVFTLTVDD